MLPGLQRKMPSASAIAGGHWPSEALPPCKATGKTTARISSFCNTEFLTVVCFPGQSFISTLPEWKHPKSYQYGYLWEYPHGRMELQEGCQRLSSSTFVIPYLYKEGKAHCLLAVAWNPGCSSGFLTWFSEGCWLSQLKSGKSLKHVPYFIFEDHLVFYQVLGTG